MNRRSFLKNGLLSGAVLVTGSSLYGCSDLDILDVEVIDDAAAVALGALVPVFLAGALPSQEQSRQQKIARVIAGVRLTIKKLPPHTLKELDELFILLTNRLTMLACVGQFAPLNELSSAQVRLLIEGWRNSFISLLNTAYEGLKELVFAAFYGDSDNWSLINYQKPNLGV
ncbi:MAG: hypothetical protein ACI9FJ_001412 [Alteromonadaceae bacterium]|jgi:hypothetical protein